MLSTLLSLIFPPSADELRVKHISALTPEPLRVQTPAGNQVLTCARYHTPDVRTSLRVLKNKNNSAARVLFANLVSDVLLEEMGDLHVWTSSAVRIVPIPLSPNRRRMRGFNQVESVCAQLPASLTDSVDTSILKQVRATEPQKSLTRDERFRNVAHAFRVTRPESLRDAHVVVVDDVLTTGATLDEAIRTLADAGAHVHAVTFTRA